MKSILFLILSFIVIFAIAGVGIYILYQLLTNFQPGKNKVLSDLRKMRDDIQEWTKQLVPWDKEEMGLLSLRQVNQKITRGLNKTAKGIFTSIYHEPLLVYSYKKYLSTGLNAVLYARTSKHEFAYRFQKKKVDINVNNQYIGALKENGGLYGGRKNRLLARINRDDELKLHPIVIGEKEVASVVNTLKTEKHNPRAFQFVTPMKEEEEKIFLALAVLEMVTDSLKEEF